MTFAAVSGGQFGAQSANPSFTSHAIGNVVLCNVINQANAVCTALSSTNATWTPLGAAFTGTTNAWTTQVFVGKVTSVGTSTVTPTWGAGTQTTPMIVGQEFTSSTGTVTLDQIARLDSGGTSTWPSLTPTGSGEMYWGFANNVGASTAGSTSGYTYVASADGNGNGMAYNTTVSAGVATGPVWGDATQQFGSMVVVIDGGAAVQNAPMPSPPPGRRSPMAWQRQAPVPRFTFIPAWAVLQSGSNTVHAASTLGAALSLKLTSGSKMIAWVSWDNGNTTTLTSVKDTAGNSFTLVPGTLQNYNSGFGGGGLYYLDTPSGDAGATTTVTATWSTSVDASIVVQEVSGLAAGGPDGTAGVLTGNSTGALIGPPSYASSFADEYLTYALLDNGGQAGFAGPIGYIADQHNQLSVNSSVNVFYKPSTGGAEMGAFVEGAGSLGWDLVLVAWPLPGGSTPITLADVAAGVDAVSIAATEAPSDVAAGVDALVVTATAPLADAAGATDADAVPAETIPLADVAGAADLPAETATVPLADAGGAVDAVAIAAAVPLPEVAAGVDGQVSGQPITLADAAGAVDAPAISASVPLAEVAGAAEAETIPAEGITLADAAGATDKISETVTAPLADAAGAVDAPAENVTVPLADVAAAADSIVLTVAAPLAEVAAAVEALLSGQPTSLADTAGAADAISVAVAEAAAEAGAAVESLAVSVTLGLPDVAAGTDAWIAGIATLEPDAAGSTDRVTITVTVPLAEVAGAAEALAVTATEAGADVAGAADALSVAQAIPAGETAGAVDQLSVSVTVALSELGAAAEGEGVSRPVTLADTAAGADNFLVFTVALHSGTVTWIARPSPARWRPSPDPARWKATPARNRWNAEPGAARWKATPAPARWNAVLQSFDPISALSAEEVNIRWTSDLDGVTVDPTTTPLPVQAAFPVSSGNPLAPAQPVSWTTGSWLAGGTGKGFVSQHPVGPGTTGPTLTAGKYDVWGYIQGTPESPKKFVGVLTVY